MPLTQHLSPWLPGVLVLLLHSSLHAEPVPVARGVRQLFFDNHFIAELDGLERVVNQASKPDVNPVLRREHPWEQFRAMIYGTVLYDEDDQLFKMWYTCMPHNNTQSGVTINGNNRVPWVTLIAYATSQDGLTWTKPLLRQLDFNGSLENNLVDIGRDNVEGISILKNRHSDNPDQRWIAFFWEHRSGSADKYDVPPYDDPAEGNWGSGMWVAYSPDGVNWKNHGQVINKGSDTHQAMVYDASLKKYVLFNRINVGRRISRAVSPDFLHWSQSKLVLSPDPQDGKGTQIYGMSVDIYESLYVGLPWMYYSDGVIDVRLAYSRNGIEWFRPEDRKQVIAKGPEGSWDAADFRMGNTIVTRDDKIYLYYCAAPGAHPVGNNLLKVINTYTHEYHQNYRSMHIGVATLRRDGWISLDAQDKSGHLVTRALAAPGGRLHVNVDAEQLAIELLNQDDEVLTTAQPISGDHLAKAVHFANAQARGPAVVKLKMTVTNGKLYSFWWD